LKAIISLIFLAIVTHQLDDLLPLTFAALIVVVFRTSDVHQDMIFITLQ
jgi:hypothetical protein